MPYWYDHFSTIDMSLVDVNNDKSIVKKLLHQLRHICPSKNWNIIIPTKSIIKYL